MNLIHNPKRVPVYVVFLFLVFLVGCDKIPFFSRLFQPKPAPQPAPAATIEEPVQVQGTLLARIDRWTLTLEDFNQKIQDLQKLSPDIKIDTLDDKKVLLEELVRQQLLVQDALARGLDKKKDVESAVEEFRRGLLVRELINELTVDIKIDAKDIEAYYNQFKDSFREPTQWHVREIVVSTMDQARDVLVEALKGADFAGLAAQYSKSPSAQKGGDLGFISQAKFPQLETELASMDAGSVSKVLKGPDGFYIVKLEEKKGGRERPLSEVWDEIKEGLTIVKQNEKLQEYITKLRQNARVEVHEDLLK